MIEEVAAEPSERIKKIQEQSRQAAENKGAASVRARFRAGIPVQEAGTVDQVMSLLSGRELCCELRLPQTGKFNIGWASTLNPVSQFLSNRKCLTLLDAMNIGTCGKSVVARSGRARFQSAFPGVEVRCIQTKYRGGIISSFWVREARVQPLP
jgi:hypothetical protein